MERYQEYQILQGITLCEATLRNMEFVECTFERCELDSVQFLHCQFTDCVFSQCKVTNPVFENCTMTGGSFEDCRLFGVNWSSLSSGFIAPIERLQGCQLKYNNFIGCDYPKFHFEENAITESLFGDCNLAKSRFCCCHLHKTEFFRCDLTGASFEGAEGYIVDISNCKLKGAVFSFPEVTNLLNGLGIVIK